MEKNTRRGHGSYKRAFCALLVCLALAIAGLLAAPLAQLTTVNAAATRDVATFDELKSAVATLSQDETIRITADFEVTEQLVITKAIKLDLNGKKITTAKNLANGVNSVFLMKAVGGLGSDVGHLEIIDSTALGIEIGNGTIECKSYNLIENNNIGSISISNVTISSSGNGAMIDNSGTANATGGQDGGNISIENAKLVASVNGAVIANSSIALISITGNSEIIMSGNVAAIANFGGGTVDIKDSVKISSKNSLCISNESTLNISGASEITRTSTYGAGAAISNSGVLNMNGGTVNSIGATGQKGALALMAENGSKITISGGTLESNGIYVINNSSADEAGLLVKDAPRIKGTICTHEAISEAGYTGADIVYIFFDNTGIERAIVVIGNTDLTKFQLVSTAYTMGIDAENGNLIMLPKKVLPAISGITTATYSGAKQTPVVTIPGLTLGVGLYNKME